MPDDAAARIAQDLGIADRPQEEQRMLIAQFGEVALKAATISVLSRLSEELRAEFSKLSEAGDIVALKTFLDREVPDHDELVKRAVTEEVQRFKKFQAA